MAEGHGRERWAHTALICSLIANSSRDPRKQRPYTPDDFNPHAERDTSSVIRVDKQTIPLLRAAFTGRKGL